MLRIRVSPMQMTLVQIVGGRVFVLPLYRRRVEGCVIDLGNAVVSPNAVIEGSNYAAPFETAVVASARLSLPVAPLVAPLPALPLAPPVLPSALPPSPPALPSALPHSPPALPSALPPSPPALPSALPHSPPALPSALPLLPPAVRSPSKVVLSERTGPTRLFDEDDDEVPPRIRKRKRSTWERIGPSATTARKSTCVRYPKQTARKSTFNRAVCHKPLTYLESLLQIKCEFD